MRDLADYICMNENEREFYHNFKSIPRFAQNLIADFMLGSPEEQQEAEALIQNFLETQHFDDVVKERYENKW